MTYFLPTLDCFHSTATNLFTQSKNGNTFVKIHFVKSINLLFCKNRCILRYVCKEKDWMKTNPYFLKSVSHCNGNKVSTAIYWYSFSLCSILLNYCFLNKKSINIKTNNLVNTLTFSKLVPNTSLMKLLCTGPGQIDRTSIPSLATSILKASK